MPQALITINAVAGSNVDLPINTLVQLGNTGIGGETTYAWTIVDQPPGSTDALSNPAIINPTFTPKKEGTYLLRLIVNAGPSQLSNQVVAAVRFLKTRIRVPAAGETNEASTSQGWSATPGASDVLRLVDTMRADPTVVVASAGAGGLAVNDVVKFSGTATIKSTLPGQEIIPSVTKALANVAADMYQPLGVVVGEVGGGAIVNGSILLVRRFGQVAGLAGAPAVGAPVFASDTATLSLTAGTTPRRVGVVIAAAATYTMIFDGAFFGTPDAPPVISFGDDSTGNAAATTTYGDPWYGTRTSRGAAFETFIALHTPGVIRNARLRAYAGGGPTGDKVTFTLRKNAVDTAITFDVLVGVVTGSDLVNSVTFVAGDRFSLKQVSGPVLTKGVENYTVTLEYTRF